MSNSKKDRRAFVLLSGGIDSSVALRIAYADFGGKVEAVSINYGQRHMKEIEYAGRTCAQVGDIKHVVLDLPNCGGAMLTDLSIPIPDIKYDDIKGVSPTYVPFRNGLMLSILAAHAQKWTNSRQADEPMMEAGIYFGAHAEDAANWAYPDCTPEFIGAMANAIYIGTYQAVRLHTPLMWMRKASIVSLGAKLGVDFSNTWSCYAGKELHCGACPTCYARREAFIIAGEDDPTEYEADKFENLRK